jgi:signal peptidase I
MSEETAARRKPWLAGLLSLAVPGLGQLYNGQPWRAGAAYLLLALAQLAAAIAVVKLPLPGVALALPLAVVLVLRLVGIPFDAFSRARRLGGSYRLKPFNRWSVYLAVAALAVLFSLVVTPRVGLPVIRTWMQAFHLQAGSMEPTLLRGDHVLVDMSAYRLASPFSGRTLLRIADPRRGDVVVFRYPEDRSRVFEKRLIALPGETVSIRGHVVEVDGARLTEDYARFILDGAEDDAEDPRRNWGPQAVPAGHVFVLGDNRDNSRDSRFFGFVPLEDVLGRVVAVYWSVEAPRERGRGEEPAGAVRWGRLGHRVR